MKAALIKKTFLLILVATLCTVAQAYEDPFNTDAFWRKVHLDKSVNKTYLANADTMLVVASNRRMLPGNVRFMDERREKGQVRYFFVYTYQHIWHVVQANTLKEAIGYLPDEHKDWVVYAEGMGKLFTSDLYRGLEMAGSYHVNVLMLDYPSITTRHGLFRNYLFAIHNARVAYKDLSPVLDTAGRLRARKDMGDGHLTLFFHSMGNNLIRGAMIHHKLKDINSIWADNIVLNAACVKQRHHNKWVDRIHFAKNVYIIYNPNDKTLSGAHLVSFRKQLGEKVRKSISKNAIYINMDMIAGERHSNFMSLYGHADVMERIISQYKLLLHGDTLHVHDTHLYMPDSYRGIGWDLQPE
ncbi:MAG TPA: hypothetical protein VHA52_01985 [Candidatus Babeliaceae bacterium]|nr:hypothetical protein [Candidatus Babeliaceae bacterium]